MTRIAWVSAWMSLAAVAAVPVVARGDLAGEVDAALRDPGLGRAASVGVQVVRLGPNPGALAEPRIVYRHDAVQLLTPASNLKVLTTSAALDTLGPKFEFHTQLVLHGNDLILVGDGDPAFCDAELLSRNGGGEVAGLFKQWAAQAVKVGVTRVDHVAVDDTVFDATELFHPRWPADQRFKWYEAEVAGMNLNANCVDLFVRPTRPGQPVTVLSNPRTAYAPVTDDCVTGRGTYSVTRANDGSLTLRGKAEAPNEAPVSITVHDPALYAATVMAEAVVGAGLPVGAAVQRDATARAAVARGDPAYRVLAINTTPLPVVLNRANKDSMNLYAECLCKRLGANATGGAGGSWVTGTAVVASFLRKVGVPEDQFKLDDGCGLSKQNGVTAAAMTQVLAYDFGGANAKVFMDTLPVAGADGTLAEWFGKTSLKGRVLAKTGTVNGVKCLSGYLHGRDGQWYAFSVLMNHLPGSGKQVQERVVQAIDDGIGDGA